MDIYGMHPRMRGYIHVWIINFMPYYGYIYGRLYVVLISFFITCFFVLVLVETKCAFGYSVSTCMQDKHL